MSLGSSSDPPSVSDIVDALMLLDEPMLNSRYHGLLLRLTEGPSRDRLVALPGMLAESLRLSRKGSFEWMRSGLTTPDAVLRPRAERTLLEAFLALCELETRLITLLARAAPTAGAREPFDEMARIHRTIAAVLRDVLRDGAVGESPASPARTFRGVQELEEGGDLLSQVESALRDARAGRKPMRSVVLSADGLRRLRDQGCFGDGETTLGGVPVEVDFAWDVPAFALRSFDVVPIEEVLAAQAEQSSVSRKPS